MGRAFLAPRYLPGIRDALRALGCDAHAAAKHLHVADRTVYHWLKTDRTPRAALLALFWESHEGHGIIAEHATRGMAIYKALADSLQRENAALRSRIARLENIADFGSANAPTLTPATILAVRPRPATERASSS